MSVNLCEDFTLHTEFLVNYPNYSISTLISNKFTHPPNFSHKCLIQIIHVNKCTQINSLTPQCEG